MLIPDTSECDLVGKHNCGREVISLNKVQVESGGGSLTQWEWCPYKEEVGTQTCTERAPRERWKQRWGKATKGRKIKRLSASPQVPGERPQTDFLASVQGTQPLGLWHSSFLFRSHQVWGLPLFLKKLCPSCSRLFWRIKCILAFGAKLSGTQVCPT